MKNKKLNDYRSQYLNDIYSQYYEDVLEHLAGQTVTADNLDIYARELGMSSDKLLDILDALVNDAYIYGNNEKIIYKIPLYAFTEVHDAKDNPDDDDFDLFSIISGEDLFEKLDEDIYDLLISKSKKSMLVYEDQDLEDGPVLFYYSDHIFNDYVTSEGSGYFNEDGYEHVDFCYGIRLDGIYKEHKAYEGKAYINIEYPIEKGENFYDIYNAIKNKLLDDALKKPYITDIYKYDDYDYSDDEYEDYKDYKLLSEDSKDFHDAYTRKSLVLKDPKTDVSKYLKKISNSRIGKNITIKGSKKNVNDTYKTLIETGLFETSDKFKTQKGKTNCKKKAKPTKSELKDVRSYGLMCWELEEFMRDICQNEELYYGTQWLEECYPDGDSKKDVIDEFDTKEDYENWRENAKSIYKFGRLSDMGKNPRDPEGIYELGGYLLSRECSPRTIEIAHEFDRELGFDPIEVK